MGEDSIHHEARKALWKKALATKVATVEEIRRCAVDAESQDLLQMSLQLAGIRIIADKESTREEAVDQLSVGVDPGRLSVR